MLFEPIGELPQWQIVYDRISTMSIEDRITDKELFDLLPGTPEGSVRSAFWRAVREVEFQHKRSFDRVRKVGYRMVKATEHERLARSQHRAAIRRLKAGVRKARSADRSLLGQDERHRIDTLEKNLDAQARMTARLSARVTKTEEDLRAIRREQQTDTAHLSERVDALAALLARHGISAGDPASTP